MLTEDTFYICTIIFHEREWNNLGYDNNSNGVFLVAKNSMSEYA